MNSNALSALIGVMMLAMLLGGMIAADYRPAPAHALRVYMENLARSLLGRPAFAEPPNYVRVEVDCRMRWEPSALCWTE